MRFDQPHLLGGQARGGFQLANAQAGLLDEFAVLCSSANGSESLFRAVVDGFLEILETAHVQNVGAREQRYSTLAW